MITFRENTCPNLSNTILHPLELTVFVRLRRTRGQKLLIIPACPCTSHRYTTFQLLDSDHEVKSDIKTEWTLFYPNELIDNNELNDKHWNVTVSVFKNSYCSPPVVLRNEIYFKRAEPESRFFCRTLYRCQFQDSPGSSGQWLKATPRLPPARWNRGTDLDTVF